MKSYVTIEQKVCICCEKKFDTNALLLDKKLRDKFDAKTVTGIDLCPKCHKKDYILLIECKNKSVVNDMLKPEEADRTGQTAYVKKKVFSEIFNVPCPKVPFVFVEEGLLEKLKEMMPNG